MSTTANVTVEEIPLTPAPRRENIQPGRRVRLVNISPVCLNGLTGTTQRNPHSRATTRLDVLLDESSTEIFLRRDPRVANTRKVKAPRPRPHPPAAFRHPVRLHVLRRERQLTHPVSGPAHHRCGVARTPTAVPARRVCAAY